MEEANQLISAVKAALQSIDKEVDTIEIKWYKHKEKVDAKGNAVFKIKPDIKVKVK